MSDTTQIDTVPCTLEELKAGVKGRTGRKFVFVVSGIAATKRDLTGVVQGPAGPLERWPFVLKKDGQPVDEIGLGGGTTQAAFRNGKWFSGDDGAYKFEDMPHGSYVVEVLLQDGHLDVEAEPPPVDDGERAAAPPPIEVEHDYSRFDFDAGVQLSSGEGEA